MAKNLAAVHRWIIFKSIIRNILVFQLQSASMNLFLRQNLDTIYISAYLSQFIDRLNMGDNASTH